MIRGKRREFGLGRFPDVSLAKARAPAALNRATVAEGGDPLADKRREKAPRFRDAAATVHETNRPRWRSDKHAPDWLATLNRHAFPSLGHMTVDTISRIDVLDVLTPIWTSRPETARRVRQRSRAVMQWAVAHGYAEPQSRRRSDRRRAARHAEGQGAPPGAPLCRGTGGATTHRRVPILPRRPILPAFLILTGVRSGNARPNLSRR